MVCSVELYALNSKDSLCSASLLPFDMSYRILIQICNICYDTRRHLTCPIPPFSCLPPSLTQSANSALAAYHSKRQRKDFFVVRLAIADRSRVAALLIA